jgi:hypothetical protein
MQACLSHSHFSPNGLSDRTLPACPPAPRRVRGPQSARRAPAIHLDGLPGGEVEQRAARGRGRRLISLLLLLRQQDPPARVEAVVDDACAQLTGLPDAAAVHPQLAHQAEPHEVGACGAAVTLRLPECGGCAGLLGTPDSRKDRQGASVVG